MFQMKIPQGIRSNVVSSFFPIINASKTIVALAISFQGSEYNTFEKDKYSSLIMIDLKH